MILGTTDFSFSWVGESTPHLLGVVDLAVTSDGMLVSTTRAGNSGLAVWDAAGQSVGAGVLPDATATGIDTGLLAFDLEGGSRIIAWGVDGSAVFDMSGAGQLTGIDMPAALPGDIRALEAVTVGMQVHLFASRTGDGRVAHWTVDATGYTWMGVAEDAANVGLAGLSDFAQVAIGPAQWLVAVGDGDDTLVSYRIATDGGLALHGRLTPEQGPGIADPSAVAVAEIIGGPYVLVAGRGSNSLSVFTIDANGAFAAVDHVLDSLQTRFKDIHTLDVRTVGDATYVLAAGGDDGLTVLQLVPGGRLLHLVSLEDRTDIGLSDISAAVLMEQNGRLALAVTSATEAGLTIVDVATHAVNRTLVADQTGQTLTGSAGHDVLVGQGGLTPSLVGVGPTRSRTAPDLTC